MKKKKTPVYEVRIDWKGGGYSLRYVAAKTEKEALVRSMKHTPRKTIEDIEAKSIKRIGLTEMLF